VAAFNFPNSPSVNQTHTENGITFKWDGSIWKRRSSVGIASLTVSTSAPGSPASGDMWWDSDDGDLHVYYNDGNSSQWVMTSQGPMGATGAAGSAGAQGVQGAVGAQGHQGHQGRQGNPGAQGAQGAQGRQGAAGAQGAQGHQGVQGAVGAQGAQGVQGAVGAQGAQGVQGAAGSTGSGGSAGAQGHQGVQGATGAQGHQGVQGAGGSATISNNADNRVITGGSGTNLNAESNLLFDGTTLSTGGSGTGLLLNIGDDGVSNTKVLTVKRSTSRTTIPNIQGVEAGVGSGHFELQGEGGNVAIGDVAPTEKLHVVGGVRITGAIKDKDNSAGSSGQVLSSTGTQIDWINSTDTGFPSGTTMLFHNDNAPTGWTKKTASNWNNRALRMVTGSVGTGGSNDFTTAFVSSRNTSGGSVSNHTLTTAQIPSHRHWVSRARRDDNNFSQWNTNTQEFGLYSDAGSYSANDQNHSVGRNTAYTGSGNAHNHGFTNPSINLNVKYHDVIIATKD
jgi:hypothetical protein